MQPHSLGPDLFPTLIAEMMACDASFVAKVDWLKFIEPSIVENWRQGNTSVKPVHLMTEDDLVH